MKKFAVFYRIKFHFETSYAEAYSEWKHDWTVLEIRPNKDLKNQIDELLQSELDVYNDYEYEITSITVLS